MIHVEREDYLWGEPMCPIRCPIARACLRLLGVVDAVVGTTEVVIAAGHYLNRRSFELPEVARELLHRFDHSRSGRTALEPVSFEIPGLDEWLAEQAVAKEAT